MNRQDMFAIPVPAQTSTYKPVSNQQIIETILENADKAGFSLKKETYTANANGQQTNGRFLLNYGDKDMGIQVGFQNSYDKTLSLKIAVGTEVFICANGVVRGDIATYKSKHRGAIQTVTPEMILNALKDADTTFDGIKRQFNAMKKIELDKRAQAELAGRIFIEDELITSTQLNIIKREINNPTHDYKAENSLYEFYNHCTFALKDSTPKNWMQDHINLHDFVINEWGITVRKPKNGIFVSPAKVLQPVSAI